MTTPTPRLAGKRAVVTGGSSGIGAAVVERFRADGASVVNVDVAADADVVCDVTDARAVGTAFDTAVGELGGLDLLVTSAGIAHIGTATSTTPEDFARVLGVNVIGVYHCLRSGLGHMGQGSAIVNIVSIAAVVGIPDRFAYSASKGAVLSMTRSVAADYLDAGIRCNAISPARVHTPFVDRFLADTYPGREQEMFDQLAATQPIGRMGTPEEVAGLAAYLCSDEASFLTGTNQMIDGGFTGVRP